MSFPGATATYATGVNSTNKVTGLYTTSTALSDLNGSAAPLTKKIAFPGANNFTRALAINDSNEIVGDFLGADGFYHGFTDISGRLKQYDVPGGKGNFSTSIFAIDTNGDLAGSANGQGFVSIGGVVTMFHGSGTDLTYALGINDSGVAVGQYFDSGNLRTVFSGRPVTITEIVYLGATQTAWEGINNAGEITGFYYDASGVRHGFTYTMASSQPPICNSSKE